MKQIDKPFLTALKSVYDVLGGMVLNSAGSSRNLQHLILVNRIEVNIQGHISGYEALRDADFSDYKTFSIFAEAPPVSSENRDATKKRLLAVYGCRLKLLRKYNQALQLSHAGELGIMQ